MAQAVPKLVRDPASDSGPIYAEAEAAGSRSDRSVEPNQARRSIRRRGKYQRPKLWMTAIGRPDVAGLQGALRRRRMLVRLRGFVHRSANLERFRRVVWRRGSEVKALPHQRPSSDRPSW
jgi:hypothetical protein